MIVPGSRLLALFSLLMTLAAPVFAQVTASLDRDQAVMGDTLRLTLSTRGSENMDNIDLRPLLTDFDILRRSTSTNTSIVNGERTTTRDVMLDISPKREGTLRVPPMRVGNTQTNLLLVAVGPAVSMNDSQARVLFEAEIDQSEVYVQGQILLTLRIQQAINLDGRSVSEVQLDNAFVKALEQKSFQRRIDGRQWLINEIRYAIFPEQSGTLEIPAQVFTARERVARRSLFDNSAGKALRLTTDPIVVKVLGRPDNYPAGDWLPAQRVTLEETWSVPPEQLQAGESATRTVRISGEGLQGAQLPPILFPAADGLKYYPDQPIISDTEVGTGLLGSRQDSAALVPTRAGNWEIPEISIPWWDTQAQELRYAVIPARQIQVTPAAEPGSAQGDPGIVNPAPVPGTPTAGTTAHAGPWRTVALACALGWVLTLLLWWYKREPRNRRSATQPKENQQEATAYKQLMAACASGHCGESRKWLIRWGALSAAPASVLTLEDLNRVFTDTQLSEETAAMDAALYRDAATGWDGTRLASIVKRLRKQHAKQSADTGELTLYPA